MKDLYKGMVLWGLFGVVSVCLVLKSYYATLTQSLNGSSKKVLEL